MKFCCDKCNYLTIHKGHFTRHLKTKKHKKNIENVFECDYCLKTFKYSRSLKRHIKVCINKLMDHKIKKFKTVLEDKFKGVLLKEKLKNEIEKNEQLQNIINIHSQTTTYNNVINVIIQNYPNAPNINDIDQLLKKLPDKLMQKFIDQGVPDGVINYLRKALLEGREPNNMPFWCVDASRQKCSVKDEDEWKIDLKGTKIKDKLLPVVRDIFCEFSAKITTKINTIQTKSIEDLKRIGRNLTFVDDLSTEKCKDKVIKGFVNHIFYKK